MSQYRNILPRMGEEALEVTSESSRQAPNPIVPLQGKKRTRKRHSIDEWEAHKPLILQLYDTHELKDVIRIVKIRTGFDAGIRRYKDMLASWGREKYVKGPEMQFVLQKSQDRMRNEKKATSFIIRDTQLENDQILRYQARSQMSTEEGDRNSVQALATPEGVQYFTPRSSLMAWQLMEQSPHAFTPTSKRTASAVSLYQASTSDPFTATILAYDRVQETKQIEMKLQPPRKRRPSHSGEPGAQARRRKRQRPRTLGTSPLDANGDIRRQVGDGRRAYKRHSHQDARFAGLGNGRFNSGDRLIDLLWQGLHSSLALSTLNSEHAEGSLEGRNQLAQFPKDQAMPQYLLETNTESAFSTNAFISQIKKSSMIRKVLGLTKDSYNSWAGEWRHVQESEAPVLRQVANHCFGDPFLSFPSLGLVSVMIKMEIHSPVKQPFLLRVTYGRESRSELTTCAKCENSILLLDFSGPSGALKLQVPTGVFSATYATKTLDDFSTKTDPRATTFNDKFSSLAYQFQGFHIRKHFRCCHCNGRIHELGFREHYIDMEAEVNAREEKFDPHCLNEGADEDAFHPYPLDMGQNIHAIIMEDYDHHQDDTASETGGEGDNERWDPNGDADESKSDDWDPCPSEDEVDSYYITQAVFYHAKRS